jgi:hypothetical protein
MTMHLVGPWLTTTGKKKGKRRFRTASNAAQARELQSDWQALLDRHGATPARQPRRKTDFEPMKRQPMQYRGSDQPRIPSLPFTGEVCARPQDKVYTGDKMIGIGQLHKSNAVPVFSGDDAKDIAKMRR